jgi:hypothetical protein
MDNDELKRAGEVMIAAAEGKPIQYMFTGAGEWHDIRSPNYAPFDWSVCDYRIKPQKKLRPWTPDEVPITWLRDAKYGLQQYTIQVVSPDGIHITSPCKTEFTTFAEALNRFEYKRPDGSWHPCGVEVKE